MIYLVAESTGEELPIATAGSLNELAEILDTTVNGVCKMIKGSRVTSLFGVSVKVYKIAEE